jgi:hypothetical protein
LLKRGAFRKEAPLFRALRSGTRFVPIIIHIYPRFPESMAHCGIGFRLVRLANHETINLQDNEKAKRNQSFTPGLATWSVSRFGGDSFMEPMARNRRTAFTLTREPNRKQGVETDRLGLDKRPNGSAGRRKARKQSGPCGGRPAEVRDKDEIAPCGRSCSGG